MATVLGDSRQIETLNTHINFGGGDNTGNNFKPIATPTPTTLSVDNVAGTNTYSLAPNPVTTSALDQNSMYIAAGGALLVLLIIMRQ